MLRQSDHVICDRCRSRNPITASQCIRCGSDVLGMDYYRPTLPARAFQRITTAISGLPFEPPRIVDTHQYYPQGTINFQYIKDHGWVQQISVGIGMQMGSKYIEQVEAARNLNIPIVLWHIPDRNHGMAEQVQEVFSWPYVKEYTFCMDVEKPRSTTEVINATMFKRYAQEIEKNTTYLPMVYSTERILRSIFGTRFPSWYQYWHWIAQYVYKNYPNLYNYFDEFIPVYGCQKPFSVRNSQLFTADPVHMDSVVEWQFSDKGREPFVFPGGPLSRDLSLGLIPMENLLRDVVHWAPRDPIILDISQWVQEHTLSISSYYASNKVKLDMAAGVMQATMRYPDVSNSPIEERHIFEKVALELGVPTQPYLYRATTTVNLNVRNAPSVDGNWLRTLKNGTEVTIYEEKENEQDPYVWGRIDPGKAEWVATNFGYLDKE